jgi:hypothetical protein
MSTVESARQQWDDGARRLARESDDPARYRQLCDLVDAVVAELRRRVGQHYSLEELAAAHRDADAWVPGVIRGALPRQARVGLRDASLVQDAAFYAYARGAGDYRP